MRTRYVFLTAIVAACLTGCYEEPGVTIHEPGVYKGSADPVASVKADERADALQKRFTLVQSDR